MIDVGRIARFLSDQYPTHVRLHALRVLAQSIPTRALAFHAEEWIRDSDGRIVEAGLSVLTSLFHTAAWSDVLTLLERTDSPRIVRAALRYFSEVPLANADEVATLSASIKKLLPAIAADAGIWGMIGKTLAVQIWNGVDQLEPLLDALFERESASADAAFLGELLNQWQESREWDGRYLSFDDPALRAKFVRALERWVSSTKANVSGRAYLVALRLAGDEQDEDLLVRLRSSLAGLSAAVIDVILEATHLGPAGFFRPDDVEEVAKLIARFEGKRRQGLVELLCAIGTPAAMQHLVTIAGELRWNAAHLALKSLLGMPDWKPEFARVVDLCEGALAKSGDVVDGAAIALANARCRKLTLARVLDQLDRDLGELAVAHPEIRIPMGVSLQLLATMTRSAELRRRASVIGELLQRRD